MDYICNIIKYNYNCNFKECLMKKLPRISESEWLVMRVLWSKSPLAAQDVFERLQGKTKWKPKTAKTLIDRLVKKGAVKYEKEGRRYMYYPAVGREECIATERQSFLRRVYGGITKPMLAAFLEDADLSADDISELKEILEQKTEE